jgi:hypothetical protein
MSELDRNDPDYEPPADPRDAQDRAWADYRNSPEHGVDRAIEQARAAFLGRRVARHLSDAIATGQLCTPAEALILAKVEWENGSH